MPRDRLRGAPFDDRNHHDGRSTDPPAAPHPRGGRRSCWCCCGAARRSATPSASRPPACAADADTLATTVAGQSVFADQAAQRAELARVEAEDKAREAARLEAEAAEHRAAAEATRRDYEATMRRADDIDPDVKESAFPAVAEADGPTPAAADPGSGSGSDDGSTMTRAERRAAREAEEAGAGGPGALSGVREHRRCGGAAGAASRRLRLGERRGRAGRPDSERIASAADFRDDVSADADEVPDAAQDASGDAAEVYPAAGAGTDADMSDDARTETAEHAPEDEAVVAAEVRRSGTEATDDRRHRAGACCRLLARRGVTARRVGRPAP